MKSSKKLKTKKSPTSTIKPNASKTTLMNFMEIDLLSIVLLVNIFLIHTFAWIYFTAKLYIRIHIDIDIHIHLYFFEFYDQISIAYLQKLDIQLQGRRAFILGSYR